MTRGLTLLAFAATAALSTGAGRRHMLAVRAFDAAGNEATATVRPFVR